MAKKRKRQAHLRSGNAITGRQRKALDSLDRRINTAIDGFLSGACVRKTPYEG